MIARAPLDNAFGDRLEPYRERVNRRLARAISSGDGTPERLRAAMEYSVLGAGKRVRPLLAYASGELAGIAAESIDAIAASVELIHAYSLIHDDLPAMDDDDLRRGRATAHRRFDEATAILAGDALQALAFETLSMDDVLASHPASARLEIVGWLARAVGPAGMVGGQSLDMEAEGRRVGEAALENIHRRKTGALLRASIMMPSVLGDMPDDARDKLDAFARDIGLMFQIRDDLLEVEQDTEALGKSAGSDRANDKSTYPSVLGADGARVRADELHERASAMLEALGPGAEGLAWLADFILRRSH